MMKTTRPAPAAPRQPEPALDVSVEFALYLAFTSSVEVRRAPRPARVSL